MTRLSPLMAFAAFVCLLAAPYAAPGLHGAGVFFAALAALFFVLND